MAAPDVSTTGALDNLPPLPSVPKLELPPPTPESQQDVSDWLRHVVSPNLDERVEAVREMLEIRPRHLPAISQQLARIADKADKNGMKAELNRVLERRRAARRNGSSGGASEDTSDRDLLFTVVQEGKPSDHDFKSLAELVALSRMLAQIGSVEAARELITVYVRFGEFVRPDVQHRLAVLGDRAVAALIEARRYPAEKIARWAERQLDRLGKAIPSEAIRTDDYQVLADILRAYGRTRDIDAARIVMTFANSERHQVRQAARQAIVMLGSAGLWQLRDAYENVVGKRPKRDWSWQRTARELFGEYDRLRLARVFQRFEDGMRAMKAGDLTKMAKAFDAVLVRDPLFERRAEMASGYLAFAREIADSDRPAAELALARVERISQDPQLVSTARSLRLALQGQDLASRGIVDERLARSALNFDPSNQRAKDLLKAQGTDKVTATARRIRYATSGTIAGIALVAIAMILLRRRSATTPPAVPTEPPTDVRTEDPSLQSKLDDGPTSNDTSDPSSSGTPDR